jgi:PAS domain S-box-containing protein
VGESDFENDRISVNPAEGVVQLAALLDGFDDAFVAVDSSWRYTMVNRRAGEMLGYPSEYLLGRRMDEMFPDVGGWPFYRTAMQQRVPVRFESYAAMTDIWVEVRAHPSGDGIAIMVSDITSRKVAELALVESRARADMLAMLLDDSSQPFMVGSPEGRFLLFNRAFEELTGRSASELGALKWPDDVTSAETLPLEKAALARIDATGEPQRFEKEFVRPDGVRVPVEVLRHGHRGADGRMEYYYAFLTDITERRAAQRRDAEGRRLDEALNMIAAALMATLDSREVVRRLVHMSADVIGAETAGITRGVSGAWEVKEAYGMRTDAARSALSDAMLESVLLSAQTSEPIVVDDVESDDRVDAATMRRLGIRSLLAVPIITPAGVVGALIFHHRSAPVAFGAEQVEFARRLMGIVPFALENARLYERERRIADALQSSVLTPPEPIRGVECSVLYRPASASANIGGDFCDVFRLDDDRVGVAVGDVSGKGLDAAPLTLLIHDGIRAFAYEEPDPAAVVGHLNTLAHRFSTPETFATLVYGVLEPSSGRFRYCRAGHPPPIVVGAAGTRALDGDHSPMVGAFQEARYITSETVLDVAETLVLYTDGIIEARADREMFGEQRLVGALRKLRHASTDSMPHGLTTAVLKYTRGVLEDDIVVLCVKRTS